MKLKCDEQLSNVAFNVNVRRYVQDLDHFSWASPAPGAVTTFQQRYLVFDKFWTANPPAGVPRGRA